MDHTDLTLSTGIRDAPRSRVRCSSRRIYNTFLTPVFIGFTRGVYGNVRIRPNFQTFAKSIASLVAEKQWYIPLFIVRSFLFVFGITHSCHGSWRAQWYRKASSSVSYRLFSHVVKVFEPEPDSMHIMYVPNPSPHLRTAHNAT